MDLDRRLAEAIAAVKGVHFDAGGMTCDYAALSLSGERGRLAACLADLAALDPGLVRIPGKTAFWINIFNAVVLRDSPELELADRVADVQAFFERPRLKLGAFAYSLDDIQHGLLRGNLAKHGRLRAPMSRTDPRLAHMPLAFDERIHFAMYSASRSSPALRVFEAGKLERELEEATAEYIRRTVRCERDGAKLVLPRQFRWYPGDFGGEQGIIEFVAAFLDEEYVVAIDRRRGRVKLRYAGFDWTLNRK